MPFPIHHPSRRALLLAASMAPLLTTTARAQTPEDPIAVAVLALFDPTADAAVRAAFHQTMLSPAGQRRWPLAEFEKVAAEIATASGGLELMSSRLSGKTLWIRVRARRTGAVRSLRVRMDRDDAGKVFDVSTSPMPTPYEGPAPDGAVDREMFAALIDRRIRYAVALDEFSGAVRVVAPDGAVVYEAAFGLADGESGRRIDPDMRFNIGSADKSFTALIIARLVQEQRLTWDMTLAEVLPDYPNRAFARVCTLRHLATHTAGLGALFNRPGWNARRPYSKMADLFDVFAAEAPSFAPGASAAYSNEGFVVLGAVAEAATGRSWYDLLSAWVYQPAGMTRSGHLYYQDLPPPAAIALMRATTSAWSRAA